MSFLYVVVRRGFTSKDVSPAEKMVNEGEQVSSVKKLDPCPSWLAPVKEKSEQVLKKRALPAKKEAGKSSSNVESL